MKPTNHSGLNREGPKANVLVIDCLGDSGPQLAGRLELAGYDAVQAADGLDGLRQFYRVRPDLVVLDLAMPGMDGWLVLERLREVSNVPVLLLTASLHQQVRVESLRHSATHHLAKPFAHDELIARVEAALAQAASSRSRDAGQWYKDSQISIDFPKREVLVRGQHIGLSGTEFRLLRVLAQNAGQVLSQARLLDHVWGRGYAGSTDLVRLYIGYLRRKIEQNPKNPTLVETVRGFGYRYHRQWI